jgi:curli production assembly/transport component CsgG
MKSLGKFMARGALFGACALALAGCQSTVNPGIAQPSLAPITKQSYTLRTLPPPKERIYVSVYDFPDLTGQFKDTSTVQTLSKAVTQGGAPMLIKALVDAGERRWFSVLDRSRLDDLLKERQIVTEMRRIYRGEQKINPRVLPPLRHAGIILEGGIIGYDTNTKTGGLGAAYLGIGADTKYQQDTVTVTLRAVSTDTGEVLASTTVHKVIASYGVQGDVFRYIELDKILQAEAGVTANEPKQVAVQQAIEKAVTSLIIEGARLHIWSFANPVRGQEIIKEYMQEKYGEKVPVAAVTAPPPVTKNPTDVVETVAATPRRVSHASRPPAAARPTTPPPPAKGETVGSIAPAAKTAESGALPPPAARNEVVGSADKSPHEKPVRAVAVAFNDNAGTAGRSSPTPSWGNR